MAVKIFCCYAHEDELLLKELKSHLRPLQRQGLIDVWYDRDISVGSDWEREINKHLDEADIVLLLVSPNFMDSDYCYSIEMQRALERQSQGETTVIPIILRWVRWQGTPIGKLQAVPQDGIPVVSHHWHSRDEAFFNIAEEVCITVEKLLGLEPTAGIATKTGISGPIIKLFDEYVGMLEYRGNLKLTYIHYLEITKQNGRELSALFYNDELKYDKYECTGTIMDNNIPLKGKRLQDTTVEMNLEGIITENREIKAKGTMNGRQFEWLGKNK